MPQDALEITVDEEQLNTRLCDLLHQMNQQYQAARTSPPDVES